MDDKNDQRHFSIQWVGPEMNWKIYPATQFQAHQERWQRLNLEGAASPLLDVAFIWPLLQTFGTGKEILACYERDDEVVAMALLSPRGRGAWETFQPSQAPLGAWIHKTGTTWPALLSSLIRKLPGFPLVLGVTQQDPDIVRRPLPSSNLKTLDYIQTARISLHGNFDGYWNTRGKNLRQNLTKQRNKLAKEAVSTRLQVSTAESEVAQAIADYGHIESAGWKAEVGTAIHPDNLQGQFYTRMLEAFCRQGAGRIYRYWYNDTIVAMDLCIEGNGSLVVLKTTYDEKIGNGTSPALLMRQEAFKPLFDDRRLKKIEFYGKAMEWHTKWSDEIRTMYHVNEYRWPAVLYLRNAMANSRATGQLE